MFGHPFRNLRKGGRRWWIRLAIVLALLVVVYAGLRVAGGRRHEELRAAAARAAGAVGEARKADAMTWAPDELLSAEAALREGEAAQRIERVRWWPIPHRERVKDPFSKAEDHARQAVSLARQRRESAEHGAYAALQAAEAAIDVSVDLAGSIHLVASRRTLLASSRLALAEARVYLREGDFGSATLRARQAQALAEQVRDHAADVAARYADGATVEKWRRWRQETIDRSRREGRAAIVVSKEAHTLTLFVRGQAVKTYRADMGFNWIADKLHAGDGATPEGRYHVVARKANGASIYYKALLLDYPNAEDRAEFARARRAGEVPPAAAIGGLIEIHGEGGRGRDWTRGCVAVTNREMDELFARVPIGTPVTIVGSDDYGPLAGFATRHRDDRAGR